MSRWGRAAAAAAIALSVSGGGLRGQVITLQVSSLKADSMPPAPNMLVTAPSASPDQGPYAVSLELSTEQEFARPFYLRIISGQTATFTIDSLLPERILVYMRARLLDTGGGVVAETRQSHRVQGWLELLNPAQRLLVNLQTREPQFRWSSPPITFLWEYDLTVINTLTGSPELEAKGLTATSFVFTTPLEANTSYSWRVTARGQGNRGSGEVMVRSVGTFVIESADRPTATVAYQNFPNPFGRGTNSATTCFWFDLDRLTLVQLTIYDLRLRRVRTIVPGPIGSGSLVAGAYGRREGETQAGCDMRLSWDGRDAGGRFVPPGIYLAEFRANGQATLKKIFFKGP